MYDIAIIGLGPAGATLARLLRPDLSILALDKKNPGGDDGFHKPCGGLLAPDAQKALSKFGLTLPLNVLVNPQIFSVRTLDVPSGQVRHYQRFYVNMDRHKLDLWLKSLIPPHVQVHHNAVCSSVVRKEDGWRITWRENGQEHSACARYLVGADGAASIVRKALYPKHKIKTYLSIQQWFYDAHPSPFYSCMFDPAETDCYTWGLSKNEYFIFGGAFPLKGARARFDSLKEKLTDFGFVLRDPVKTEACLVLRPSGINCRSGKNGAFLIGEAGGFISPSSLEGLSFGMNSAHQLSRVLNAHFSHAPNRRYFCSTLAIRLKLFLKHLKCPFMYFPPLRWLVMKSRLNTISVEDR